MSVNNNNNNNQIELVGSTPKETLYVNNLNDKVN